MSLACWIVLIVTFDACRGLQWTSPAGLRDNATVAVCEGQDVALGWAFTAGGGEHVQTVEWYYSPHNDTVATFIGIVIGGQLFPSPNATTAMEYIPNAGIRLLNVSAADSGVYSARVTVHTKGFLVTYVQNASVVTRNASSITADGHLHAQLLTNATTGSLVLACGHFDPDWASEVDVWWTTPSNQEVRSTSYDASSGRFLLELSTPMEDGVYACSLDGSSPVAACLSGGSVNSAGNNSAALWTPATVTVDSVEARLALLQGQLAAITAVKDGRLQTLEAKVDELQAEKGQMAGEIQDLRGNSTELVNEVAALTAQNAHLQQELQMAAMSVGFHARKTSNLPTLTSGDVVDFREVLTNQGGAYNATSGVFVAPVNGTYDFHVTVVLDSESPSNKDRHVSLVADGARVSTAVTSFRDHFEMGTCHAVLALAIGQRVYVVSDDDDAQFIGADNTFSGALLHAALAA